MAHLMEQLAEIKAEAASGPLQHGKLAYLIEQLTACVMLMATTPAPPKKPDTLDLFAALPNGNTGDFIASFTYTGDMPCVVRWGDRFFACNDYLHYVETTPFVVRAND